MLTASVPLGALEQLAHPEIDQSGCLARKVAQLLESGGHTALLSVKRGEIAFQFLQLDSQLIAGVLCLLQRFGLRC